MGSWSRGRVRTTLGIFFVALALQIVPASADWQYTRWGMSPDEVKAASNGDAVGNPNRSLDADGLTAQLVAPYNGSTLPFTAVFLFGIRDRLAVVTLMPKDGATCGRIPDILRTHYGPPLSDGGVGTAKTVRWNDYSDNNVVSFLDLGGGECSIEYSKLLNTRNDGTL